MHPAIFKAVKDVLDGYEVELLAYKCTIMPAANEGAAFLDYYYFKEEVQWLAPYHMAQLTSMLT